MSVHNYHPISQAEYEQGLLYPLHPMCLATNEIYVARLLTPTERFYATEVSRLILKVETNDSGYLVSVALPESNRPKAPVAWSFDANGLRQGVHRSSINRPNPDGYFVAGRDAWDDGLTGMVQNKLVLS